jgi:hypothetical protein
VRAARGDPLAIAPTRARYRHDLIERVEGRELIDDAGQVATPWRVVPLLEGMRRRGAITLEMRSAGEEFHDRFRLAQLDGLQAASLMGAGGGSNIAHVNGNEAARKAVMAAIDALGGGRAPAASCAWHVLGEEWSLRRWVMEFRRGSVNEASGVLIAALGVLARRVSA